MVLRSLKGLRLHSEGNFFVMSNPLEHIARHVASGFVHVAPINPGSVVKPVYDSEESVSPKNLVPLGTPDLGDYEALTRLVERLEEIEEVGENHKHSRQYVQDVEEALIALKKLRPYW